MSDVERVLDESQRELDIADELLTVAQAAAFLKVEAKAVRKWVRAGVIKGAKRLPSGHLRIPKSSLKDILRAA